MTEQVNLKLGDIIVHKETLKRWVVRSPPRPQSQTGRVLVYVSPPGVNFMTTGVWLDECRVAEPHDHSRGFNLEEEIAPRIFGWLPWAWEKEVPLLSGLNTLASSGGLVAWQGDGRFQDKWARFFLEIEQGGYYNGGVYVLKYGSGGAYGPDKSWVGELPSVWQAGMCKHEKVEGPGANPRRGWHPGRCKHCGMDMSVDSGD